jgi:anaerobic magnesium-protoporphyrin IX monomethyl ester cyclase
LKVLFVEPPKAFWFVMGEYLPPPLGLLCLAAYLETHHDDVEIQVVDCQAEGVGWDGLEQRIKSFKPDIVAPSALSTANAYLVARTTELAKRVNPMTTTLAGGLHYSVLAQESLEAYPELDAVVRGEGEQTLLELVRAVENDEPLSHVKGLSFRRDGRVVHTPDRPVIKDLDTLPFPGYHFVRQHMKKYHFTMMAGKDKPYALLEASRGCDHNCAFCGQWRYWGPCRRKSPKRVADEFEHVYREYGSRFLWLVDDNLGLGPYMNQLCDELIARGITDDLLWFLQARVDDIIASKDLLAKMRRTGVHWILTGVESHDPATLEKYRKGIEPSMAKEAIDLLKQNNILAQATAIIGERHESHETLEVFRRWIQDVSPDIAIFMVLTPFPGTELYKLATEKGWIEATNWANYDMVHAIMPTEHLTRAEVQHELYQCYRSYYGSWGRRIRGLFSSNWVKRTYYRYMMRQGILRMLRGLF